MNHAAVSSPDLVDRFFREHHARGAAPTIVWGVFARDGRLVHDGSAGESQPSTGTAYRIASCTKSFTAASLLLLRDEGALSLDDPITRFVPAFASVALPEVDAVPTLRMLATMSGGLPTDDPWADRLESLGNSALTEIIANGLRFDSTPGTQYAYSNLGYALLGQAIEVASGQGYREFVTARFLAPLGLDSTGFDRSVPAEGGVIVGARSSDNGWLELPFSEPGSFSPIGGLFSTVRDLARWGAWLASAFDDRHGQVDGEPLSRASRREMQQLSRFIPQERSRPSGYGYGLVVEHDDRHGSIVSHSGGYPGFSAHMRWSTRSGIGVVAFANATGSRVSAATAAAVDALLDAQAIAPADGLWPETRAAQHAVNALIAEWSDERAAEIFSDNVALDESYERRRAQLAEAIEGVGGLAAFPSGADAPLAAVAERGESSVAPSQLRWLLPGRIGRLSVAIQLTPENPPRVQSLTIAADRM